MKSTSILKGIAILVVLAVAAGAFIYSGVYNVAASKEHSAPVKWLFSYAMARSVAVRAGDIQAPDLGADEQLADGASSYKAMCVTCHGAPGEERSFIGKGLNPPAPDLGHSASKMTNEELFWVMKHGIKMTGMPAFGATHEDDELWPLVAFVRELPEMTPERYNELASSGGAHHHHDGGKEPGAADSSETGHHSTDEHDHHGDGAGETDETDHTGHTH